MIPIKKVYGYMTRVNNGRIQILVFQHPHPEAGIQIPKDTVQPKESTSIEKFYNIFKETEIEWEDTWQLL